MCSFLREVGRIDAEGPYEVHVSGIGSLIPRTNRIYMMREPMAKPRSFTFWKEPLPVLWGNYKIVILLE
jgi:hypothetical protein